MTIESTRAPEGAKPTVSGTHRAAAKPGQVGSAGTTAGQGFAGLMSQLSASDTAGEASDVGVSGSDALLSPLDTAKDDDQNVLLALDNKGLVAMNSISSSVSAAVPLSGGDVLVDGHDASSEVSTLLNSRQSNMNLIQVAIPLSVPVAAPVVTPPSGDASAVAQAPGKAFPIQATDKRRPSDKVDTALATLPGAETPVKDHGGVSEVSTLLNSRQANASSTVSQVQAELREVRTHQLAPAPVVTPDVSRLAQAMASVNGASNPAERTPGKLHSGTPGAGMEGLFGTALADKLGMSPTYEVAPATAVVPDTQVAETVSYWATHGVQSAELTLDGLGNEPVEVRISVDGDQTQVDFRSNQPEVRQALESASAQLKTMLSGEGLQLTGMSIGTSGRGQTPGEGGQPKPSPRQTARVALAPAVATTARVANLSVGQALDLYV